MPKRGREQLKQVGQGEVENAEDVKRARTVMIADDQWWRLQEISLGRKRRRETDVTVSSMLGVAIAMFLAKEEAKREKAS